LIGSSLGTLPFIVLYTYAGSVLMAPGSTQFFVAFAALAALSIASLVLARRLKAEDAQVDLPRDAESPAAKVDFPVPGEAQ
jgi:uncharacterized membrane protein YdjX (TVP38/TMEM64 family)